MGNTLHHLDKITGITASGNIDYSDNTSDRNEEQTEACRSVGKKRL